MAISLVNNVQITLCNKGETYMNHVIRDNVSKYTWDMCFAHCGIENLPKEIMQYYENYEINDESHLISRIYVKQLFERYQVPVEKQNDFMNALEEIEKDEILFRFTKFLVHDMCQARNRMEADNYQYMEPGCMRNKEWYSFLLLLACVEPSMKQLEKRGVPEEYYEHIPYRQMDRQFAKWINQDDVKVADFPWDMNFYTCSIFLLDRFLFIPYRYGDQMTFFRENESGKVIALSQDVAWAWVNYLAGEEANEILGNSGAAIPAHTAYSGLFFEQYPQYNMEIFAKEATECAYTYPTSKGFNEWADVVWNELVPVYSLEASLEDACANITTQMNDILAMQ